jgi:predicted DNA-binding transcriptional regulator AlpA
MNKKSELLPPLFIDIDETADLLRIGRSSVYKLITKRS